MSFAEVELKVIRWSEARQIIQNSTAKAQWKKAQEEMLELAEALDANNREEIIDALGDVMVCLINIAAIEDLDLTQCLKSAYEQIKSRTGRMGEDGIFYKDNA